MRASWGSMVRAVSAERRSWVRSKWGPALDIGWPLRSVSPVSEALGVRPVNDLNAAADPNRCALPTAACRTGPPHLGHPRQAPGQTLRVDPAVSALASFGVLRELGL